LIIRQQAELLTRCTSSMTNRKGSAAATAPAMAGRMRVVTGGGASRSQFHTRRSISTMSSSADAR
jgi:hypothetical protein